MAMKINSRQQLLAALAVIAVALLGGDKLVWSPLTASWKKRATRIADLRKEVSQGEQLLERESTLRSRWQVMATNTLPANASAAQDTMLKAFERWSQASRISLTSIRPQWKRTDDDYMTLECRADAQGNLQALTRFLYEVEKDPLALKVESIEITARDNDGQQLGLALQVSGLLLNPQEP
jgi:Tfp pilus assembly protein PilO